MSSTFDAYFRSGLTAPVPAWSGRPPVLLISHDARRTGAPALLLALAEALRRMDRFDLRILTRSGGPLVEDFGRIAPVCVGTDIFPSQYERHVTLPALIAKEFSGLRRGGLAVCNTVVVPEYNEAFRHFGIDVLTLVHELPEFFSADTMDLIVRSSRYIAIYSDWNSARFSGGYRIPAEKLVIAPPIVTPLAGAVTTADERRAARRAIGVPEDALLVLCVATLYPIKGYDLLLQIVARCARDLPPDLRRRLQVCWVGDTEAGHRLYFDHDVKALGLTDIVSLAGEQADPWPWYQAADVYACSSRWESMGLSVVEAMSAGLPVVGFADVGAIAQLAAEGAGAVVHGLDIDCFAGHLVALLQDPALRARWGETGHRRVRRMFGSGEIPLALKDIFAAVAARGPIGAASRG